MQAAIPAETSFSLPQGGERETGLLYVRSGGGVLTGLPGEALDMKAGSAAVYPARHPHLLAAREDTRVLACLFPGGRAYPPPARAAEARHIPDRLETLARTVERAYGTALSEGLPEILLGPPSGEAAGVPQYVQAARRIMDTCYREDLTLEELSARVGRSKYHLSRAFRVCCHMAPGAYLASVRLARAAELLADTDLPVGEIGGQVGFSNSAYFTARFKKRFGLPPREYRAFRRASGPAQ